MTKILVDSDVILDLFLSREPHHRVAVEFFSYLDLNRKQIDAFTSALVIANVAYILQKIKTKKYALSKIRELRKILSVATITQNVIDQALNRPHKDFEDSIQYHSALEAGLPIIVTRDSSDFISGELQVLTPQEFLAMDIMGNALTGNTIQNQRESPSFFTDSAR